MNKKNFETLKNQFPELLKNFIYSYNEKKEGEFPETIFCDDGWYALLKEALLKIRLIKQSARRDIFITCIKGKFGSLRIHVNYGKPEWSKNKDLWDFIIDDICSATERDSLHICEICSKNGSLSRNKTGWVQTLCEECVEKKIQQGTINEDLLHTFGNGIK